jgi:methionyl-tRNA formyltransferase
MIRRRIVILGKNALAVECLRTILAAGDDVVLAFPDPSDDGVDGWQPSFSSFASSAGVPVHPTTDINDPGVVAEVAKTRPDFLLSFQAAQLMKAALLETPAMGALNLHFGPLPRYRGVAPVAWALINGEAATGVTLHHIKVGVDNGPIIGSKRVPIHAEDTGRTVYDRCSEAGIELFRESWAHVRRETPPGVPQSEAEALYYNRHSIDFSRHTVAWQGDAEAIANWVRALIFPPFQFPVVNLARSQLEIGSVRWDRLPHRGRPGELLEVSDEGITVAAPGGRLTLQLRLDGADLDLSQFVRLGIAVGAVLS